MKYYKIDKIIAFCLITNSYAFYSNNNKRRLDQQSSNPTKILKLYNADLNVSSIKTIDNELTILKDHKKQINSVAISPDNRMILTGSYDNTAILYNITDPRAPTILAILKDHKKSVNSIAFSSDNRMILTGSYDNTAILYNITDPRAPTILAILKDQINGINAVAFSHDSTRVLTVSGNSIDLKLDDNSAILYDVTNPKLPEKLATLKDHKCALSSVAFSYNNKMALTGSWDSTAILYDLKNSKSPERLATLENTSHVTSVAFSPDNRMALTGSDDGIVILWNITSKLPEILARLQGHTDTVISVAFSPDSTKALTGSRDNTAIIYDITNPSAPVILGVLKDLMEYRYKVKSVAFSYKNLKGSGFLNRYLPNDLSNIVIDYTAPTDKCLILSGSYRWGAKLWAYDSDINTHKNQLVS